MAVAEVEKITRDPQSEVVDRVITEGIEGYANVTAEVIAQVSALFPERTMQEVGVHDPRETDARHDAESYRYSRTFAFVSEGGNAVDAPQLTLGITPQRDRSMSGRRDTAALDLGFTATGTVCHEDAKRLTKQGISTTNVAVGDGRIVTTLGQRIGAPITDEGMKARLEPYLTAVTTLVRTPGPQRRV